MQKTNALLDVLRGFETEFKQEKDEFNEKFHHEMEMEIISMPGKYKGPMHRQLEIQMNVWFSKMMVKFKLAMNRVLVSFANNNEKVNGYANDAAQILMTNLVGDPEDNLTNQFMGTSDSSLSELLIEKQVIPEPIYSEEWIEVCVDGQEKSVKVPKLDSTQSINAQPRVSHKPKKTKYRDYFLKSDDLTQHSKVKHPASESFKLKYHGRPSSSSESSRVGHITKYFARPGQHNKVKLPEKNKRPSISLQLNDKLSRLLKPPFEQNELKRPVVSSPQSSISTEPKTSTTIKVPIGHNSTVNRLGFKCFQLNCQQIFRTEKELNHHMWMRHCIRAFPCMVMDCDHSFDTRLALKDHIEKDHENIQYYDNKSGSTQTSSSRHQITLNSI